MPGTPLCLFLGSLRNTHPEMIVVSDNAKILPSKTPTQFQRRSSNENPTSQPCSDSRWDPLDYSTFDVIERLRKSRNIHYSSSNNKGHSNSSNSKGYDSRWTSLNDESTQCSGLTRPCRNISRENLTSLHKVEKAGNESLSLSAPRISSSLGLPPYMIQKRGSVNLEEYQTMSIPRPKTSLKGRTLSV